MNSIDTQGMVSSLSGNRLWSAGTEEYLQIVERKYGDTKYEWRMESQQSRLVPVDWYEYRISFLRSIFIFPCDQ